MFKGKSNPAAIGVILPGTRQRRCFAPVGQGRGHGPGVSLGQAGPLWPGRSLPPRASARKHTALPDVSLRRGWACGYAYETKMKVLSLIEGEKRDVVPVTHFRNRKTDSCFLGNTISGRVLILRI